MSISSDVAGRLIGELLRARAHFERLRRAADAAALVGEPGMAVVAGECSAALASIGATLLDLGLEPEGTSPTAAPTVDGLTDLEGRLAQMIGRLLARPAPESGGLEIEGRRLTREQDTAWERVARLEGENTKLTLAGCGKDQEIIALRRTLDDKNLAIRRLAEEMNRVKELASAFLSGLP
jgi:hypothetical protein